MGLSFTSDDQKQKTGLSFTQASEFFLGSNFVGSGSGSKSESLKKPDALWAAKLQSPRHGESASGSGWRLHRNELTTKAEAPE
jgi:hypothetical protein